MLVVQNSILSVSFLFLFFQSSYAQTGREILDKYLDTVSYGNVGKWDQVTTFYSTSRGTFGNMYTQFSTRSVADTSFKKTFILLPGKMKEELYKDSLFLHLSSEFYFFKDKKVIIFPNMQPMEFAGDNSMFFDFLPVMMQKQIKESKAITYNGINTLPGMRSPMHEVEIQTRDNIRRFFFNTKSFLLEAILFPEVNIFWFYDNYKDVDGYLMPMTTGSSNNGNVFSTSEVLFMVFNQSIDKDKFRYK